MRRAEAGARRGVALLEALVALVIIAITGAVISALVIESATATERSRVAEVDLRRARAFFEAVTLWPREDLDRHLGDHQQGSWRLRVDRVTPLVYSLALTDSSRTRVLLSTAVYRPEALRGTP
jgi:type II secretory pathway pseudopilin PulG